MRSSASARPKEGARPGPSLHPSSTPNPRPNNPIPGRQPPSAEPAPWPRTRYEAAIATTERVAEQKRSSKGPSIPVQTYDETGRCPVVGSCGGGDLGVMPEPEEAKDLPDDGDAKSLCVGANCNGGGGGGGGGKKGAKKEEA